MSTQIDRKGTQTKLSAMGYDAGPADGLWGKQTYAALLGFMAKRQPDSALTAIAAEMAHDLPNYAIDGTAERLCEFLAQTCHESAAWTRFSENMNYSAARLTQVWPARFPAKPVGGQVKRDSYAYQPEKLANYVYANRMGNGSPDTGDGFRCRGGGMLQHTGLNEYNLLHSRLGYTPADVRDPVKSVQAACDYWSRRYVNDYIDKSDFRGARKAVNGGILGLAEIAALRTRALGVVT